MVALQLAGLVRGFDNRDVGLSAKLNGAMKIGVASAFARAFADLPIVALYGLDDMALDDIGLMDALGMARGGKMSFAGRWMR